MAKFIDNIINKLTGKKEVSSLDSVFDLGYNWATSEIDKGADLDLLHDTIKYSPDDELSERWFNLGAMTAILLQLSNNK